MGQLRQRGRVRKLHTADVDLVASGVSKECSDEDLKTFLENKGVNVVAVEMLTKADVLPITRRPFYQIPGLIELE